MIDAISAGDRLDVGGARVVVDKIDGDEVHIHDDSDRGAAALAGQPSAQFADLRLHDVLACDGERLGVAQRDVRHHWDQRQMHGRLVHEL